MPITEIVDIKRDLRKAFIKAKKYLKPEAMVYDGCKAMAELMQTFFKYLEEEKEMHKKIMKKAAKALEKDAKHYAKEAKHEKKAGHKGKAKHEIVEKREASSAAKDLKKRARKAHEY